MTSEAPPSMVVEGQVAQDAMEDLGGLLDGPVFEVGSDRVPPMWHLGILHPRWLRSELGVDGHPKAGVPAPPGPGYRRMFAGGTTRHLMPIRIGMEARRETTVLSSAEKAGRSGQLRFVTVRHRILQKGAVCIVEDHEIVYRASEGDHISAPSPRVATEQGPRAAAWEGTFAVDSILLFRFSCATRNAHRIHYDPPYAATEGYSDLVIHGPLQILLMAGSLNRVGEPFQSRAFRYRMTAPAVGCQRLLIRAGIARVPWAEVRDSTGAVTATATIEDIVP